MVVACCLLAVNSVEIRYALEVPKPTPHNIKNRSLVPCGLSVQHTSSKSLNMQTGSIALLVPCLGLAIRVTMMTTQLAPAASWVVGSPMCSVGTMDN